MKKIDFATIAGIVIGPAAILTGQWLEGGNPSSLLQASAALIVLGGTLAACLFSFSPASLGAAVRDMRKVFFDDTPSPLDIAERIIRYADLYRKEGGVQLEKAGKGEPYGLLGTGLDLITSGTDQEAIKVAMERSYYERVKRNNEGAEVFEIAGGYMPTFGILGAVLGLIHTMQDLSDPAKVGIGISTAFVATIYGVGIANLVAFPIAHKIRARGELEKQIDSLVIAGINGIRAELAPVQLRKILNVTMEHMGVPIPRQRGGIAGRRLGPGQARAEAA